jgi:NAD(P)H-dependent FMN reductase
MKASLRRLSRAALLAVTLAAILPSRAHVQQQTWSFQPAADPPANAGLDLRFLNKKRPTSRAS